MAGRSYARGRWAVGICQRSGRKMLLRDMIADGYYPNLIVDPAYYEPKHPQESLPALEDPVALYRPAPDDDNVSALLILTQGEVGTFWGFGLGGTELEIEPPSIPAAWFEDDFSSYADGELLGE